MKKFILLLMLAFSLSLITAQVLFDGFETGNTQGSTTINGWTQATGPTYTSKYWTANTSLTDYNRTPRTGSWNVFLQYGGEAWLFAPVSLTGSTSYDIELYARQDGATATNANIGIYYGTTADIVGMTNTIVAQTGLVNGNYQKISASFTPDATQTYYIGIKGYIDYSPWYISLDDIKLQVTPNDPEPTNHVTDFAAGTLGYTSIQLNWTGSTGAQLPAGYLIQAIKVGTGSYVSVTDTNPVANDAVWTDGNAAINVAHVVGANTYTFTGLVPNTAYEFKIWPYTNSGALINYKVDDPIPTVNASTLDATIYAEDLPYPQNFDSVTAPALPGDWSKQVSSTSTYAYVQTYTSGTPYSAPNHAYMTNSSDTAADLVLISPPIDPDLTGLRVRFWAKGGTGYTLQVGTMDGGGSRAVFTNVETINLTSTYTEYTVAFDAYEGTDQYIAFKHGLGGTYRSIYIDDVVIELIPTNPILSVSPNLTEPWPFGDVLIDSAVEKSFTVSNSGPGTITINTIDTADLYYEVVEIEPIDHSLEGTDTTTFKVVFTPLAVGDNYEGTVTIDYGTRLTYDIHFTGNGIPYGVSTATSTADDDIGQIILGSFANPATAPTPLTNNPASDQMYNDYTALGPIDIQKTVATPLTLTQINSGSYYTCHFKVFIDYNQNLAFDLPDELALTGSTSPTYGGSNPYNGFITVPVSATEGTTRMRIVLQETSNPDLVLPVGTYSWGETEDYTVNITAAPAILTPSNLSATNVDGDSAELSWTENNTPAAELWDIKYGAPGFDPETGGIAVNAMSANPYTLTGLSPNTSYHWYVRSITGPVRDVSAWAGPGSFTTTQIPATLPFAEDWESGQDGWTFVNGTQTNAWYVGAGDATYTPYEGTSFAYISNNSGTNVAYTNTATSVTHIYRDIAFDAASVEFPLSFMWKCVGETTAWDKMRVYVVDTSVTPVAGTALTTGQVGLANYNGQANWTAATITLPSTLSGTTKRVVFSWSNDSSSGTNPPINLDYINLTAVPVTSAPNPANLVSPLDDAINVPLTQTLNWSSGGGYVEGYRLSFGTVDPYAVIVNDEDLEMATTYDPVLAYSTEYWWTVTPYNTAYGDATSITEWSFTTRDDPTKPLPYVQNFDSGTSLALIDWTGTMYISANHGTNGTNGLTKNIYYTSDHDAVTPPIGPMTNGVELKFDYRIVDWYGYPGTATVLGASDNVQVQISTDSGTTYTPIHTINQANHVTSTAFATVTVPLTAYTTGNIMLKFLGTWGEGDYYLDIDNVSVMVPATAPEAPLLVYPGTDATDLPKTGFDLSWQNNPLGLEPDYFVVYMWTDAQGEFGGPFWETADASVTTLNPTVVIPEGETEPLTFAYDERWNWTVSAVVGTTEVIADSRWFVIQSDPTNYDYPYEEPFDEIALGALPEDWTLIDYSGGWQAAENIGPYSLPYAATIYYNSTLAKDDWMITLPMYMEESTLYNVSFMLKAPGWDGTPEALALHVGDAPTVAAMTAGTTLYDNNALEVADWINVTVPFTPAADGVYYFGWHAYSVANVDYIAVDDVMIFIPEDVDLAATGISGDGGGFVGSPVSTTVTVSNLGTTGQSSYTVYVKDAADDSILDQFEETVELGSLDSRDHVLSWTPTVDGTISIYGEVVVTGDANLANNTTGTMDVVVLTATTVLAYVGDPATTWVSSAYPFDMYYEDFVAETIYLASEMMMTSGTINAIAYYNYYDADQTRPVQIWMKNTDVNDLSAGWLDWTGYVPVFDGDLVGPAGVNEIIIPITPFTYTGGNLAIRTSRTWQGEWTSGKQWLITDNLNYTNRTRFYREDSEFVDHTAPVGGTTSNYVPNILFILDPATPITSIAAPEITISNVGSDVSVDWDLVPYAYSYEVYTSDDPYVFGTVPGYTVYTNNLTVTPGVDDVREFFKVTSATYRTDYRGSVANRPVLAAKEGKLRSADAPAVPKVRARLSK